MKGLRDVLFIGLSFGIFTLALLAVVTESLNNAHGQKVNRQRDEDNGVAHDVLGDKTNLHFYFVRSFVSFVSQIYVFICINSLYHNIEEETTGAHLPNHNTSSNQQNKSEGIDNIVCQSPPAYNEAM